MAAPISRVARTAWRPGGFAEGQRAIPEETAVAFTYDGGSYAVMMATPQDLADFALGFSLTEGIIAAADEIADLDIIEEDIGIELRMRLAEPRAAGFAARRRHLAGPPLECFLRAHFAEHSVALHFVDRARGDADVDGDVPRLIPFP